MEKGWKYIHVILFGSHVLVGSSQTKQNTRNKSVLKRSQKQSEEDLSYDGNNKPFYLLILVFTWILKFVLLLLEHDAASLKKSKFP